MLNDRKSFVRIRSENDKISGCKHDARQYVLSPYLNKMSLLSEGKTRSWHVLTLTDITLKLMSLVTEQINEPS